MNKEQFSEKVLELEAVLFHVSYGILQNSQDCEDVVQEAVLKAYANKDKLKNPDFFKTWLVRILMNECYSLKEIARVFRIPEGTVKSRLSRARVRLRESLGENWKEV